MLGARLTAATMGIMNVTVGVLYLPSMPEELVRRPLQPGQVSAVVYIENIGPLWSVMFILTGLVLLLANSRRKGFVAAHLGATFVWAFYGAAILISAFLTQPPVPVVAGAIASFAALLNLAIARGCAERGMR